MRPSLTLVAKAIALASVEDFRHDSDFFGRTYATPRRKPEFRKH